MSNENLQQGKVGGKTAYFPHIFSNAKWIADKNYICKKKKSPISSVFRKRLNLAKEIAHATVYCTAMGVYDLAVDGQLVSDSYFAPGFTSYKHFLQYQTYEVTNLLKLDSVITVTVAGGWAVGSFNYNRVSRIANDRCSLLFVLDVVFTDGTTEQIVSDKSWQVSEGGPLRFAEWYDGEIYDANVRLDNVVFRQADEVKIRYNPQLLPQYGLPVKVWKTLSPVTVSEAPNGEIIFDFGQNFAGVISFELEGTCGQEIVFRHSEALQPNGNLNEEILRTAKATIRYICKEGSQSYSPRFTYMGFRYVGVMGIDQSKIKLKALALSSKLHETGYFECSNELLNKLNENTRWSARSNFVDIPTDCPQRDERLGWTGDIAIFARTACYNYDMSAFFDKWLKDVAAEQTLGGSIPMVVPRNGDKWPPFTTAVWGESCILVPWAEYLARGNIEILETMYPTMKRFIHSAKRWAGLFAVGKRRYIWKWLFQFGDWCAPVGWVKDWLKRGKWIATAYFANSCNIMSQTAKLLGCEKDAEKYLKWRKKIEIAYRDVFTDGKGNLKKPFQSAYILPLYFNMVEGNEAKTYADNLAKLVKENDNHLATGFPSTPFLLFALADNGHVDTAFDVLLNETRPGWLYAIKQGATTIWERWDAVYEDGTPNEHGMGSLNHYAYGSVCDFFYRRILGIEATSGGYKTFVVKPVLGGGLTYAKGGTETPFGKIWVDWKVVDCDFTICVSVPQNTNCTLSLPNGETKVLTGGEYEFNCKL